MIALALLLGPALAVFGCGGSSSSGGAAPANAFLMDPTNGTALPDAFVGQLYSQTFRVLGGGTAPYTFRPISIPKGLTLAPSSATGNEALISGTPTQSGPQTVTFQVVDSTNAKVSNETYSLRVN